MDFSPSMLLGVLQVALLDVSPNRNGIRAGFTSPPS